jgi:hypothetical protein
MPSSPTCPEEAELLGLAMEDPPPAEVAAHLAGCASCQSRLERLKAEVALLRGYRQEGANLALDIYLSPSLDRE